METNSTFEEILINVLSENTSQALGVADAQLCIVIDKHNRLHVFTSPNAENLEADRPLNQTSLLKDTLATHENVKNFSARSPTNAFLGDRSSIHQMMHAHNHGKGRPSQEIKPDADGCWWLISGMTNDDGTWTEVSRTCIGARGCPVGKRMP